MHAAMEQGTEVAGGKHVVPPGVAVEELDGGKKKLADECPTELRDLLERKQLIQTYDDMVQAVVKDSETRSVFGKWKDAEFVCIVDRFRDDFTERGVRVALCKRSSGMTTRRWLEFIDVDTATEYVPQFDVANFSGQIIRTCYCTLEFPSGVAVEELKSWGGRKRLREKTPIYVAKIMERKGLTEEYDELVEACATAGVGKTFKNWNLESLKEIIQNRRQAFEAKGIALFVSHKQEYISHGQHGGHMENFRWIEFVDREEQPDYYPQRDAETKSEKCVIS